MNVVELPVKDPTEIPTRLRDIADQIERGEFGDCHNLGWVIDCGEGDIRVGMLGKAGMIGPELHLLLSIGALRIAHGCVKW